MGARGALLVCLLSSQLLGCGRLGFGLFEREDGPDGGPIDESSASLHSESFADHSCYVHGDGSLWCWGRNDAGQLGDGTTIGRAVAIQVGGLPGAVLGVALGNLHTCALVADGSTWCWGANPSGQLGDGTLDAHLTPVQVIGLPSAPLSISAGTDHTCARLADNRAFCWGLNDDGQLGVDDTTTRMSPVEVVGLGGVSQLEAGGRHTCALDMNGGMFCWGDNFYGQLGVGDNSDRLTPTASAALTSGVAVVVSGLRNSCAITSAGTLWCWGWNAYGQLGNDSNVDENQPNAVPGFTSGTTSVAIGESHVCTAQGDAISCFGYGTFGQLGDGNFNYITRTPVSVVAPGGTVQSLSAGSKHSCARTSTGVSCWGGSNWGQLGNGVAAETLTPQQVTSLPANMVEVSAGNEHTCAVQGGTGAVYCWGQNEFGQLGTNDNLVRPSPALLSITANTVSAGGFHSCAALNAPTTTYCWGWNGFGQLGTGTTDSASTPQVVNTGATAISQIGTGGIHTCALNANQEVRCWGWDDRGQVGNGAGGGNRLTPALVVGSWQALSSSGDHNCGIASDNALWCWGANADGQMGDNTATDRHTPNQVTLLPQVNAIAGGEETSCAVRSDGTVWCWGRNERGQLGNNSTNGSAVPVQVTTLGTGNQRLTGGLKHTCARKDDGSVWCWGRNSFGALGDGTYQDRLVPTQVAGLNALAVSAGGDHTCAVRNDLTVWCWGSDSFGQLGLGNAHRSATPVAVQLPP